jgi:undecaprenyl-diphosphatase
MPVWDAVILGVVQGITEFLPISSSGHLVLGKALLGLQTEGVAYEVFTHFGTFLAVVTVFWADVISMLRSAAVAIGKPGAEAWSRAYREDQGFRTLILILIGSVPAGLVGVGFKSSLEQAFSSPLLVSFMLLVTGCLLLATKLASGRDTRFGWFRSLVIGMAQSVAILPGISRSGSTIATAMYLGIDREEAARFSFLLALPAILGAAMLEAWELFGSRLTLAAALPLVAGFITSYLSGVVALRWLLGVIRRGRLDRFAYYCFAVGLVGIWIAGRG